jgi:hypothetical protein
MLVTYVLEIIIIIIVVINITTTTTTTTTKLTIKTKLTEAPALNIPVYCEYLCASWKYVYTFLHKYIYVGTALLIIFPFGHVFQVREVS